MFLSDLTTQQVKRSTSHYISGLNKFIQKADSQFKEDP